MCLLADTMCIGNQDAYCSSQDSLHAFYYHSVAQQHVASQSETDSMDNTESVQLPQYTVSSADMLFLAKKLLWDSQVKKLELDAALIHVRRALSKKDPPAGGGDGVDGVDYCKNGGLTPPSIFRTMSGEYLHMKPGLQPSPAGSPRVSRPHRALISPGPWGEPRSRCDSFGHVPMATIEEDHAKASTLEDAASPISEREECRRVVQEVPKVEYIVSNDAKDVRCVDDGQETLSHAASENNAAAVTFGLDDGTNVATPENQLTTQKTTGELDSVTNSDGPMDSETGGSGSQDNHSIPATEAKDLASAGACSPQGDSEMVTTVDRTLPVDVRFKTEATWEALRGEERHIVRQLHDVTCKIKVKTNKNVRF